MSIVKNSLWNILAVVLPTIVAVPSLGIIARTLGMELFGVFTLVFALVGYASIFDAGLSRAVVRCVSIERDSLFDVKNTLFTASSVVLVLGCVASVLLYLTSGYLTNILKITEQFYQEVVFSFQLMSFVIPVFLLNLVWLSYLEGLERFKELSILRVISNTLLALLPLVGVLMEPKISFAIMGLFCARVISLILVATYSNLELRNVVVPFFDYNKFRNLLSFGGWITVSNVISPIMAYFDRFILSSIIGANKVALYTAPAELVSKMLMLPSAVGKALFPKMAAGSNNLTLVKNTKKGVLLLSLTMILPLFVFSDFFLFIWLGDGYGNAGLVLKILLVGFVFNAMAQVPYASIQARGYSKLTAKIHMFELGPYLLVLYVMINEYMIYGAAIAWSLRVCVDFFVLDFFSKRILRIEQDIG